LRDVVEFVVYEVLDRINASISREEYLKMIDEITEIVENYFPEIKASVKKIEMIDEIIEVIEKYEYFNKKDDITKKDSACKFYLRYEDDPELFMVEQNGFEEEIIGLGDETSDDDCRLILLKDNIVSLKNYNEWLLKLAFKRSGMKELKEFKELIKIVRQNYTK